jgi:hypothetical protein
VGQHDMRDAWGEWGLGGLRRVRAVVANLPHGSNLRLPYDGYIRDMPALRSLRAGMLGPPGAAGGGGPCRARFVFVGGARLHDGGGGNSLRAALEECGFEVLRSAPALGGALSLTCARLRPAARTPPNPPDWEGPARPGSDRGRWT